MNAQKPLSRRDKELLDALAADFAAGRFNSVVAGIRPLLQRYPTLAPALKLLGSALHAEGKFGEAASALREAVTFASDDAQAFSNLGNALAGAGDFGAALAAHQEAIRLEPKKSTFRYNLGCLFLQHHKKSQAAEQFVLAFCFDTTDQQLAELCRQLLLEMEDRKSLQDFCRLNLRHLPNDAGAWSTLGALLLDDPLADKDEAEAALQQAVNLGPQDAIAWSNLCVALHGRTKLAEAILAGKTAAVLAPDWASAHNNLGVALRDAGAWEEAKAAFLRAVAHDSGCADAYYNLGCVCNELGELETAREAYIEALKLSPRPAWLLQGAHACRQVVDWEGAELLEEELGKQLQEAGGMLAANGCQPSPFAYLTTPGTSALQQLVTARRYSAQFADRPALASATGPVSDGLLRIGLLSSDFRDHATAHLMIGALEALDAKRFHLIAYDYSPPAEDAYRYRLQQAIPDWVQINAMSDLEVAQRMRADGVNIAIDLKGWTQGYRGGILAYRPAPVQIQWLGYPGTMGAPWLDYIVADPTVIPFGAEEGYSEKILRLPDCYQPNDSRRALGPRLSRAMLGLPDKAFVMAAFHQHYKITRDTFALWLRLMAEIPDAVLWLLEGPKMVIEALCKIASDNAIDPARLVWAPRMPPEDHLGRLVAADLALDAFPVNAHTTASDALWAGVPQVARCGNTFVSRVSTSIVTAAGLAELVTHSDTEYEALILDLARDRNRLQALRKRLATEREQSALFDARAFARHLGVAMEMAWARCAVEPDHIDVPR